MEMHLGFMAAMCMHDPVVLSGKMRCSKGTIDHYQTLLGRAAQWSRCLVSITVTAENHRRHVTFPGATCDQKLAQMC
ncbi:hypothetical protein E2C01_095517 [Portunus trituberculatus]|uniref:Uncharacterized protein n=1 Tax=Portunus trituberculatus TaxID=210409 RepID=A0A5B7K4F1_PORTR|nr:hypothetical protein [Portunus trituberculatus]